MKQVIFNFDSAPPLDGLLEEPYELSASALSGYGLAVPAPEFGGKSLIRRLGTGLVGYGNQTLSTVWNGTLQLPEVSAVQLRYRYSGTGYNVPNERSFPGKISGTLASFGGIRFDVSGTTLSVVYEATGEVLTSAVVSNGANVIEIFVNKTSCSFVLAQSSGSALHPGIDQARLRLDIKPTYLATGYNGYPSRWMDAIFGISDFIVYYWNDGEEQPTEMVPWGRPRIGKATIHSATGDWTATGTDALSSIAGNGVLVGSSVGQKQRVRAKLRYQKVRSLNVVSTNLSTTDNTFPGYLAYRVVGQTIQPVPAEGSSVTLPYVLSSELSRTLDLDMEVTTPPKILESRLEYLLAYFRADLTSSVKDVHDYPVVNSGVTVADKPILGSKSFHFDGSAQVGIELYDKVVIGSGDFAWSSWVIFEQYPEESEVVVLTGCGPGDGYWYFELVKDSDSFGHLRLRTSVGTYNGPQLTWMVDRPYHLMLSRVSGRIRMFRDGLGLHSFDHLDSLGTIGQLQYFGSGLRGWMDEIRFISGFCTAPKPFIRPENPEYFPSLEVASQLQAERATSRGSGLQSNVLIEQHLGEVPKVTSLTKVENAAGLPVSTDLSLRQQSVERVEGSTVRRGDLVAAQESTAQLGSGLQSTAQAEEIVSEKRAKIEAVYAVETINGLIPVTVRTTPSFELSLSASPVGIYNAARMEVCVSNELTGSVSPSQFTALLIQPTSASIRDSSPNQFALTTNAALQANPDAGWEGRYFINAASGTYLAGPNHSTFNLRTNDFTIEAILAVTGNTYQNLSSGARIIGNEDSYKNGWSMNFLSPGSNSYPNGFHFGFYGWAGISAGFNPVLNQIYHLAVTRSGSALRLFIDGALVAENLSFTYDINFQQPLRGFSRADSYTAGLRAKIYGIRIVTGLALYTSAFPKNHLPFQVQ